MPKETPKIAGTMMKTRSRVKRTVMEIPKRLTTRLSKGSRRNMVKGPGKAGALQPDRREAMNQSSCYSVSHVHRVCSVLREPMPKFTSFWGSERGNGTEPGKALGENKSARSSAEVRWCSRAHRAHTLLCPWAAGGHGSSTPAGVDPPPGCH